MRIQHNIAALNAHRQLGNNNTSVSKNLEKLSSGYRINRAGDDAAGLAISEKMRAQITGLDTAQKNANDGISLIQTAEGALTEVHSMLNRMVELSEQSANGTYQDSVDRENLQKELDSLRSEVNRISKGTNFNGINLLDGSLGGAKVTSTAGTAGTPAGTGTNGVAPTISGAPSTATAVDGTASLEASVTFDLTGMSITAPTDGSSGSKVEFSIGGQTVEIDVTANMTASDIQDALVNKTISLGGTTLTAEKGTGNNIVFKAAAVGVTTGVSAATTVSASGVAGTIGGAAAVDGTATTATLDFNGRIGSDLIGGTLEIGGQKFAFVKTAGDGPDGATEIVLGEDDDASEIATALNTALGTSAVTDFTATASGSKVILTESKNATTNVYSGAKIPSVTFGGVGLTLQIGDTSDSFNQLTVSVASMDTTSLEIADLSIKTQAGAQASVQKIKDAINTVSSTRGDLGALQNRLEHTINNLSVTSENMSAAESRIRDVDMAQEMMAFTKNNILTQASQAMLAQANQLPQGVLQLLQ